MFCLIRTVFFKSQMLMNSSPNVLIFVDLSQELNTHTHTHLLDAIYNLKIIKNNFKSLQSSLFCMHYKSMSVSVSRLYASLFALPHGATIHKFVKHFN